MKIVVLDGYTVNPGDISWGDLRNLGDFSAFDTADDTSYRHAADAEILLVDNVNIDETFFTRCLKVRYVGLFSTGYDQVEIESVRSRGVAVTHVPGYASYSVAQHTIALLLALSQRLCDYDRLVRDGGWQRGTAFVYPPEPMIELAGKTIGIVGLGSTGQIVARIATSLGMTVAGRSQRKKTVDGIDIEWRDDAGFWGESDVISLNAPLNASTRHIVNERTIESMKEGALIVNTARGGLVDDRAVAEALHRGRLGGYGCDVLGPVEPPERSNPLRTAPRCVITPHIAWATPDARGRCIAEVTENLRIFLAGDRRNRID